MNASPDDLVTETLSMPQRWGVMRRLIMDATEADIEHALITGRSVPLRQSPVQWPSEGDRIEIHVGSVRNVYWKASQFFAVNADLDDLPQNRHVLTYAAYYSGRGLLVLEIPEETQTALVGIAKVRVYRGDDTELVIKQQLKSVIETSTGGDVITSAFAPPPRTALVPRTAPHLPPGRRLNPGQELALAAMTSPGGYFVWGPPGTGKTTVITSAVVNALAHGRSVLIASHTNVAVDNVLKGLVEDDLTYGLGLVQPGQVIRHAGDDGKVLPLVVEHDFLMPDKAAALLVGLDGRREELQDAIVENRNHVDRTDERAVWAELDAAGANVDAIIRAQNAQPRLIELRALQKALAAAISSHESAADASQRAQLALSEVAGGKAKLSAHDMETNRCSQELKRANAKSKELQDALTQTDLYLEIASSRLRSAQLALEPAWLRVAPWERRRRNLLLEEARREDLTTQHERRRLHTEHLKAAAEAARLSTKLGELDTHRDVLLSAAEAESAAERNRTLAGTAESSAAQRRHELAAREAELRENISDPDTQASLIAETQHDGTWYLVERYRSLIERVAVLDEQLEDTEGALERLKDQYEKKRRTLLQSAPIVACTLTALTFNPDLGGRRFDVVIIDEAASASAASVIFAGSRAERTVAIVGDFLQNAPINEIENPETDDQRHLARWRTEDVFQLAGITDRHTADTHQSCVALSMQYRYPPIIADTVNAFCYEGLLESNKVDDRSGEPVVTFLDTSRVADMSFGKSGGSWQCPYTAEVAVRVARDFPQDTGFVTPYTAQAALVGRLAKKAGLDLPAGTAHKFQGREFDTVIFDLMQDDKPRWVAAANRQGNARAISAAKLLNVSLTRAKKRIFLIGNWEFIRTHEGPGMRALADLAEHSQFRLKQL